MFWQYRCGSLLVGALAADRRLAQLLPVEVGLGRVERAAGAAHHLVVLRHQGRDLRLVRARQYLVQRLGTGRLVVVGQVGRLERGAPEDRVEELVEQAVVTGAEQQRRPGHVARVRRGVLRGLAGERVEQVLGGHVVGRRLVGRHLEVPRDRARPARADVAAGRDDPVGGARGRHLEQARPLGLLAPRRRSRSRCRTTPARRATPPGRSRSRPAASAVGVAPTGNRSRPLNPKSIVTTALAGIGGIVGFTAGRVPWVITSGS